MDTGFSRRDRQHFLNPHDRRAILNIYITDEKKREIADGITDTILHTFKMYKTADPADVAPYARNAAIAWMQAPMIFGFAQDLQAREAQTIEENRNGSTASLVNDSIRQKEQIEILSEKVLSLGGDPEELLQLTNDS